MGKKRKTKKQKLKTSEHRVGSGFLVKKEWLVSSKKEEASVKVLANSGKEYFRQDLTKTFVLTMLVLALELALWNYLSRH